MKNTLRVAGFGAGFFSRFHFEAWRRNPSTELLAVADIDLDKAIASDAEFTFDRLDAMLEKCQPDILDIITPPPTHLDAIATACEYSPRVIICQKPFCTSFDEATKAISLAKQSGIELVIHENFRFQPWYRCMKTCLQTGSLGDVLQFTFRLRTGDGQGPNAYLDRQPYFQQMPRLLIHETAIHWVDTFQYLFGPVKNVYADIRTINPVIKGEDACHILFEHQNGIRSLFDGNRLLDHCADDPRATFGEALLEGTEGVVTLDGFGAVRQRRFAEQHSTNLLEAQQWPGFAGDCVYALQNHVVNALINGDNLENTAEVYFPVTQLIDTIYKSAQLGQRLEVQ